MEPESVSGAGTKVSALDIGFRSNSIDSTVGPFCLNPKLQNSGEFRHNPDLARNVLRGSKPETLNPVQPVPFQILAILVPVYQKQERGNLYF